MTWDASRAIGAWGFRSEACCPRSPLAFTLVELLVVIGIVSILIGILLPALSAARASSRTLVCASNIRQLVTASVLYAQDNGGYWPPAHLDFYTVNNHRWHGSRSSSAQPFEFNLSCLKPYLQTGRIKSCPDFEPMAAGFEASAGGYGYNNHYFGSSSDQPENQTAGWTLTPQKWDATIGNVPAKMSMIQRPSEKVAFTDAAMAVKSGGIPSIIEYSFVEPPLASGYPTSPSIHFRHRGSANIAWADGHVTAQPLEWTYPTNVYGADNQKMRLGFFGPKDNGLFQRE